MICIGENLNVMSKTLGPAMKNRDPGPIREMALAEAEKGVQYIDCNIGPARKDGPELMRFVVETVQDAVDLPCALDTTNAEAVAGGLEVHKGRALINSVTLQPDRLEKVLPLVKKYDAEVIGVLWGADGMPRDENERAMHAVDLMMKANELGIENDRLWIDPIVSPITVADLINQVKACVTFMGTLQDLVPGCKSTVGLSNISNGAANNELRGWLNRTYMVMLMRYGLHSAIIDSFDEELLKLARGEKQDVVEIIHKTMDGERMDEKSLSEELRNYYRTTRILTGEVLYSDSWLEV